MSAWEPSSLSTIAITAGRKCPTLTMICAYIRPRWGGSIKFQDDVWYVSARVRRTRNDLAQLLRKVEAYVAESGLQAIRYELDGRFYIMEAQRVEQAVAA